MDTKQPTASEAPRIGSYRLLRELGRGGQAIVWLAEDSRIGRQVALKVLPHLGPGGEDALRRFRREAEVASRLEHPGICGVLEADLDHGTPYIAMRYVAGETLARRLAAAHEAGAPPDRAALRGIALVFEKVARALHAAHEAGIVHRDVKPANVMITPEGEPVVLDFGLAREDDGTAPALSLTGEISGTPAYMSPEQMTGRSRPDRRTDVWSLGIALYEATTLAHPFAAATREGLFQSVLTQDPPDPRRKNREIDRNLATILETSTAKERDRRYQTALEMAEDLRRWRENEPILARPVGRGERVLRWMQRKPALAASIAAIAVLVPTASAFLFYGIGAAGRADVEAELRSAAETAQARAEAERSRAETERARAEEARRALEQVQADRVLSDELDELNMQMGTLLYGPEMKESIPALESKYLAAFRTYGIDLSQEEGSAGAELEALRARNPDLWRIVHDSLVSLSTIVMSQASATSGSTRARVMAFLEAYPRARWPELDAAHDRWAKDGVDEFAPLLTPESLAGKSPDQLFELAGELLEIQARFGDGQRILERSLEADPGSFRMHFLVSALGFMQVMTARMGADSEAARVHGAKLLHHMQVAVALRPRSGFVRAMLANALAVNERYTEAAHSMDVATELEPKNPLVWMFKARFYGYTPVPERGVEACKKALELDPDLPGAQKLLAELEAKLEER